MQEKVGSARVYLIIPVKHSVRFPHKNHILAPYTVKWLEDEELSYEHEVVILGADDEINEYYDKYRFVEAPTNNIFDDMTALERQLPQDGRRNVFVLLQLTQPIRPKGMLQRAVDLYLESGLTVVSATRMRNMQWRVLNENGCWSAKDEEPVLFYDGRIYVWGDGEKYDHNSIEKPHAVLSYDGTQLVDVDYKEDFEELFLLNRDLANLK